LSSITRWKTLAEKTEGAFDALFVAIGAHISKHIDIPARDAGKMLDAVTLSRGR
jgi:NADPH-dependent glutamate synthase beta subunit-like oxidoreductase